MKNIAQDISMAIYQGGIPVRYALSLALYITATEHKLLYARDQLRTIFDQEVRVYMDISSNLHRAFGLEA